MFGSFGCNNIDGGFNDSIFSKIIVIASRFMYFTLIFACTLAMVLVRVYTIFKDSIYRTTKFQNYCFVILYIVTMVITYLGLMPMIVGIDDIDESLNPEKFDKYYDFLTIIGTVLYLITYIYGMYVFAKCMVKLTTMTTISSNESRSSQRSINLNECQNKRKEELLYTSAKYVSLLSIAIITSFLTTGIYWYLYSIVNDSLSWSIMGAEILILVASVDCVVNIICLYLQYSFAKKYYDRYCGCMSRLCKGFIVINLEKSMKDVMQNVIVDVPSNTISNMTPSTVDDETKVTQMPFDIESPDELDPNLSTAL